MLVAVPSILQAYDTLLFVRTVRDNSQIVKDSRTLNQNDIAEANGIELKTEKDGFLSFALSNGAVVFLKGESKAKIVVATQDPSKASIIEEEKSQSKVQIELEYGSLYVARPTPRPASIFEVVTKFGNVFASGENMFVKLDSSLQFGAFNFPTTFKLKDSDSLDYIAIGYMLNVFEEDGKIKTRRQSISEEFKSENSDVLNSLIDARRSTAFKFDSSGKPLSAYRAIPTLFLVREKKIPRR